MCFAEVLDGREKPTLRRAYKALFSCNPLAHCLRDCAKVARAIKRVYSSHFFMCVHSCTSSLCCFSVPQNPISSRHIKVHGAARCSRSSAQIHPEKYKAVCVKLMASSSLSLWLTYIYRTAQRVFQTTQTTRVMTLHFSKRKILCQRKNILAQSVISALTGPWLIYGQTETSAQKYYWRLFCVSADLHHQLNQAVNGPYDFDVFLLCH